MKLGKEDDDVAFVKDGVYYLPIAAVAAVKADLGYYYPEDGILDFNYSDKYYVFEQDKTKYTEDGKEKELLHSPIKQGGALFVSAEDIMSVFGYTQKYVDRMGLVVLSNIENIYDETMDYNTI